LGLDGSSVLVFGYFERRGLAGESQSEPIRVIDEYVVGDLVNAVGVQATHALRWGAVGTATVAARLVGRSQRPWVLGETRSGFHNELAGTRPVGALSGTGDRSVSLEGTAIPSAGRLAVVRLLTSDLFSTFGLPEPQQITADLQLVRRRFNLEWQNWMERWANDAAVDVIDNYGP
jgi:hypothetical protein